MTKIVLLDVDGVLVTPGGYRAALRATFNHFLELMGWPAHDIPEDDLEELERRGMSSEWDMVPLLLASVWDGVLEGHLLQELPASPSAAAAEIGRLNGYRPGPIRVPEFDLVEGKYPAECALEQNCFSSIPWELRSNLLSGTRDIRFSQTMRIFQHFTLGSGRYAQIYDLPAEIETESYLLTHDVSNINDQIRARLLQDGIHPVGFTARPSGPPRGIEQDVFGLAPEAELALELVGLRDIPLVAFGGLEYVASKRGLDPNALIKPSAFHALAAVAAAFTRDEWGAIRAAAEWRETGQLNGLFSDLPRSFELIVAEDTMGGMRSALRAGEVLRGAGFDVVVRPLGFASGSIVKGEAFKQAGIAVFDNWDSLMDAIESN